MILVCWFVLLLLALTVRVPAVLVLGGGMVRSSGSEVVPFAHGVIEVNGVLHEAFGSGNPISNKSVFIHFVRLWGVGDEPATGNVMVTTDGEGCFFFRMVVEESAWRFSCVFFGDDVYEPCMSRIILKTWGA